MRILKTITLLFFGATMLAACDAKVSKDDGASAALAAAEAKLAEMTSYDDELAVIRTFIEIWDSADVDKVDDIVHSDYQRTAPDSNASSPDELKAFMLQVHAAYPDYKISNDGMAAGPDGVFVQWTVTGSDSGRGEEATGNSFRVPGISRYQFKDGKIVEELVIFDTGAVMTQVESDEVPHMAE